MILQEPKVNIKYMKQKQKNKTKSVQKTQHTIK